MARVPASLAAAAGGTRLERAAASARRGRHGQDGGRHHRARYLARTLPEGGILFTTFTRNLAADIEHNLGAICAPEEMQRVEVTNLDRWVARYLRGQRYQFQLQIRTLEGGVADRPRRPLLALAWWHATPWVVRRVDMTSGGNYQLACTGVSEIVRDRQAVSVRRGQAGRERRQKTAAFLAKRRLDANGVVLEAGLTPYPSRSLRQGFVGSRLRHRCSRRQRKDVRPMPPLAACRPLRGVLLRLRRRPSKCSRRQDGLCLGAPCGARSSLLRKLRALPKT